MGTPSKAPRLMTARQVKLFFGISVPVVYALRNQGKLATEWNNGSERILRDFVYQFLDSLKARETE